MAAPIPYPLELTSISCGWSIQDMLESSVLSGARVVAGCERLDRVVAGILPLSEVLSGSDVLDALVLYARPESLSPDGDLLTSLANRGAAALLVDGPLPPHVAESCGHTELVIIEIASRAGFAALNQLVTAQTMVQELQMMRYSDQIRASLSGLFQRRAGLQALIRHVSALARNPAMMLNDRGDVLSHYGLDVGVLQTLSCAMRQLLRQGLAGSRTWGGCDFRVELVHGPGGGVWTCAANQVNLGKRSHGWIVILVPLAIPRYLDLARYRVIAKQAASVVVSELVLQRSVEEAEERARGDFFRALVLGNFSGEQEMCDRAAYHEIDLTAPFGVFVTGASLPRRMDCSETAFLRLVRHAGSASSVRADAAVIGEVVVVVRNLNEAAGDTFEREMSDFARSMCRELELRSGKLPVVAYGHAARNARDVRESYRQARTALSVACQLGRTGVTGYDEIRSFTVLAQLADAESGRQLIRQYVDPLRSGPSLLETLTGYLAHGCNIAEAARALNVHRNTVITKLERISQILRLDIREPDNQFTIGVAVRLNMLCEANAGKDWETSHC